MTRPAILVSNDDGVQAAGIRALAEGLEQLGEVWVVAPDRERSATSHAISLHKPLRIKAVAERTFAVDGTPTDCVYMALLRLMERPPALVVSGINHGPNLGNDVLYSGTVSAAMEAALYGHRALAISLCAPEIPTPAASAWHFDTARVVACDLAAAVLAQQMPPGVLLNVNVPNVPEADLRGSKLCRLGYTDWTDAVDERHDPRGKPYYWIGGERLGHDDIVDSDNNAVRDGFVSMTPVHYDLTDYRAFSYVRALRTQRIARVPDGLGDDPLAHPLLPRGRP